MKKQAPRPRKKKTRARPVPGAKLTICSFNVGMQQNQLDSRKAWQKVSPKLANIVGQFFNLYNVNLACLSEFGSFRKGASEVGHIHADTFMQAASDRINATTSDGASCSVFDHLCALVSQGVFFVAEGQFKADMAWQILLVHADVDGVESSPAAPSGAAQPAGRQEVARVFVVIGNAHIVCGKKPTPNLWRIIA